MVNTDTFMEITLVVGGLFQVTKHEEGKDRIVFFVLSSIVKVIYQNIYFFLLNRRKGIFHNESLLILHQLDLRTYLLSEIGTFAFFSFESAMTYIHHTKSNFTNLFARFVRYIRFQ